uniref:ATP synthase complex subunit 8 n=1 Tax=Conosia irrorata TaxID=2680328 RepID=A0A7T8JJP2_9DIPT|nr:ATP synthase F0 subunit 8 [Conosia irrorata]QQP21492.1 ATP synthase F0 subunit 8 [Conosia irrorata]
MPQMAPISWLMLFIIFSCIYILFNILNYFNYMPLKNMQSKMNNTMKITQTMNWKW